MSGCKSCSSCSPQKGIKPAKKIDKLEQAERSGNPRYPHLFVGQQAIFTEDDLQIIVTVLADECDEERDCFTLEQNRVIKNSGKTKLPKNTFQVSQPVGEVRWKLQALI